MEELLADLKITEENEKTISERKNQIRKRVWDKLEAKRKTCLEDYPESCHGRIPHFKGCKKAAGYVARLGKFMFKANVVKVNPSLAQMILRRIVLDEKKVLVVPCPALEKYEEKLVVDDEESKQKVFCYRVDGAKTTLKANKDIMTKKGIASWGDPLLDDWSTCPRIDIVVVGSVAVTKSGRRLGKGLGYAELEWAILYEMGVVDQSTLVITTVHEDQIVPEDELSAELQEDHDLPVDIIVTPKRTYHVNPKIDKPDCGILWYKLKDHLKSIDIIQIIREKNIVN